MVEEDPDQPLGHLSLHAVLRGIVASERFMTEGRPDKVLVLNSRDGGVVDVGVCFDEITIGKRFSAIKNHAGSRQSWGLGCLTCLEDRQVERAS